MCDMSDRPEPTLADVLGRLDRIEHSIQVLGLEMRAGFAETRLELVEVKRSIHDLDHSMRDLWAEHLGHTHPNET